MTALHKQNKYPRVVNFNSKVDFGWVQGKVKNKPTMRVFVSTDTGLKYKDIEQNCPKMYKDEAVIEQFYLDFPMEYANQIGKDMTRLSEKHLEKK